MSESRNDSMKAASNPGSVVNCHSLFSEDENSDVVVAYVLSTLGWRPLCSPPPNFRIRYCLSKMVNSFYSMTIMAFILSGYFLQYCICYRGDGLHHLNTPSGSPAAEFCDLPIIISTSKKSSSSSSLLPILAQAEALPQEMSESNSTTNFTLDSTRSDQTVVAVFNASYLETTETRKSEDDQPQSCNSKMISHFIIPDLLHFLGYLYVFYMMRNPDCERLENLMERVFLQTSRTTGWHQENKKLVRILRCFLLLALVWVLISASLHLIHFNVFRVCFPCIPWSQDQQIRGILTYLTIASLTCFDIICIAVVTSYAVHCQLNMSYIKNLCRSVREKQIGLQEFIKRVEESRKFVDYLNRDQALGVFLLLVVFVCKISIFLYELFSETTEFSKGTIMIVGFLLWSTMLMAPLIQGVRLTGSCKELRRIGHELRARPFGYQDMDRGELDSLLLYASTLDMEAKVFHIPMRSSSLILVFLVFIAFLPLLGQINIIAV